MRRADDSPLDPDALAALAVIDSTLAGEPVAPEHAELAELALILADQRATPHAAFADELDRRVSSRFAAPARPARGPRRARRWWLYAPGAMAAVAAAVGVVVVLSSLGGVGVSSSSQSAAGRQRAPSSASDLSNSTAAKRSSPPATAESSASSANASSGSSAGSSASPSAGSPGGSSAASSAVPPAAAALPLPAASGGTRKVIQSAQISLSTRPDRVDTVAQEVFDVVRAQSGVVENSTVTADGRSSGYAEFQLSIPSANLQQTMAALSALHGAAVVSRTDNSRDVTGDLGGAGRRLADARALRRSLLRRLAAATTTTEIDSLKTQIRDDEASIASDLATLHSLQRRVDNTQISVTINATMLPGRRHSPTTGFTIGRAAHDAGRVLVIAAGVALIALAILVPLSLAGAIALWLAQIVRHRQREHALDLV